VRAERTQNHEATVPFPGDMAFTFRPQGLSRTERCGASICYEHFYKAFPMSRVRSCERGPTNSGSESSPGGSPGGRAPSLGGRRGVRRLQGPCGDVSGTAGARAGGAVARRGRRPHRYAGGKAAQVPRKVVERVRWLPARGGGGKGSWLAGWPGRAAPGAAHDRGRVRGRVLERGHARGVVSVGGCMHSFVRGPRLEERRPRYALPRARRGQGPRPRHSRWARGEARRGGAAGGGGGRGVSD
jgi:hypothetical protein